MDGYGHQSKVKYKITKKKNVSPKIKTGQSQIHGLWAFSLYVQLFKYTEVKYTLMIWNEAHQNNNQMKFTFLDLLYL